MADIKHYPHLITWKLERSSYRSVANILHFINPRISVFRCNLSNSSSTCHLERLQSSALCLKASCLCAQDSFPARNSSKSIVITISHIMYLKQSSVKKKNPRCVRKTDSIKDKAGIKMTAYSGSFMMHSIIGYFQIDTQISK